MERLKVFCDPTERHRIWPDFITSLISLLENLAAFQSRRKHKDARGQQLVLLKRRLAPGRSGCHVISCGSAGALQRVRGPGQTEASGCCSVAAIFEHAVPLMSGDARGPSRKHISVSAEIHVGMLRVTRGGWEFVGGRSPLLL
ncbi:hypothetical protein SETIT_1G026700v2 [Setaria italica]|uniref:Uncharacterized protein n=1 Tax=Setaria italica TaxID=4555 RepID=A0A368PG53_SETIT|nr:hypothetical protein SETIT_1G026700v2 [Setaria italica]